MSEIIDKLLNLSSSAKKIKMGSGLVSKATALLIVTVIVLGVLANKTDNIYLSVCGFILILCLCIYGIHKMFKLAHEKPESALLEGMELVLYTQVIQLASKELSSPPLNQQILPDPQNPILDDSHQQDQDEEEVV